YRSRIKFGITLKDITTTYTSWSFKLTDKEKAIFEQTNNEIPIQSYELMKPRFNIGVGYHFIPTEKALNVYAELGLDLTNDGKRNTLIANKNISGDPKLGFELSYKKVLFLRGGITNIYKALDNSDTNNIKKYTTFQ